MKELLAAYFRCVSIATTSSRVTRPTLFDLQNFTPTFQLAVLSMFITGACGASMDAQPLTKTLAARVHSLCMIAKRPAQAFSSVKFSACIRF
jgi:hypothetical protein